MQQWPHTAPCLVLVHPFRLPTPPELSQAPQSISLLKNSPAIKTRQNTIFQCSYKKKKRSLLWAYYSPNDITLLQYAAHYIRRCQSFPLIERIYPLATFFAFLCTSWRENMCSYYLPSSPITQVDVSSRRTAIRSPAPWDTARFSAILPGGIDRIVLLKERTTQVMYEN